ncbi:MAG TPA: GNAT family N-acetyltransferase [Steroidobacteraceae bacterium]|nr:GNAT family N-acetyltransferase [Steroidobacteraceae bacterium]
MSTNTVRDNRERSRYELDTDRGRAFIDYRRSAGVVSLLHAEVPPSLRGGGIGSALVAGTLAIVRQQGERVVPRCPFVAIYIKRHPEFQDLLVSS